MKTLLKSILDKSDGEYTEIRIEDTAETKINFQGNTVENIGESQKFGGNIRVLVNGGWGFVTFNSLNRLDEHLHAAINNAKIAGRESPSPIQLAKGPIVEDHYKPVILNHPSQIPLQKKVSLLSDYNSYMLSFDETIKSTTVRYFDRNTTLYYANSEGVYLKQEKIDLGCNLIAVAVEGTNTQYGFIGKGSSNNYNILLDLEEELKKACERAVSLLKAPVVKPDEYTVVLDPQLTGTFIHEAFGHLSEGDNIYEDPGLQKIMSLGRTFGKKFLNVYDSGLDAGHRGFLPYDDEGVPTKKTWLIKEGKLVGRLHSRETAGKMNEEVTGNARAVSYKFPPICRMRNTCVERGGTPFADMIKGIKKGVYAIGSIGGQTNGEMFTFTAGEAYMIREGKIAEQVRDVTLSGNVFQTLENIEMIGDNFAVHDSGGGCGKGGQMPLPVSHGGPHLRIKNIII